LDYNLESLAKESSLLTSLFNPQSIAIIGASRSPGKVGFEVLKNIVDSGFQGRIYPVNPKAQNILGFRCYSKLRDIKESIDLGIIVVPARIVPKIITEAGRKGIKHVIIISSGFKESGLSGTRLENIITQTCEEYGIRLLGPNCLGIIDTHTPLNASFAGKLPLKGNIAFISQSGALGTAILDWALEERIGFSKFISLGNKADVDEADLLTELLNDSSTDVILIYMEGLTNGQRFIQVASTITKSKPVIVLKSGITNAGVRAVSSHTGTMAGMDLAYDVAFDHVNVIRVNSTEELFNYAKVFSTQPEPPGQNLVIITNAGGPGILATDACEKHGLKIAPISAEIVETLHQQLPSAAGFFNPIDVLGDATAERYKFAISIILESDDVHSALIILTPQAMTEPHKVADAIISLRSTFRSKPVVTSFLGGERVNPAIEALEQSKIPNFDFPEKAIQSLSALYKYTQQRTTMRPEDFPRFQLDHKAIQAILTSAAENRRVVLKAAEAAAIINACGVSSAPLFFAATAEEAVEHAETIGYPVVLKIESPQILHKTDIGGVKLNIQTAEEVRTSFYELIGRAHTFHPRASILGVNVQHMVPQGREMIIGVNRDIIFGPLLMFGLGGIYVNFLRDVSFRLAPLSKQSAVEMIQETKAYTLLRGIRGETSSDIDSIVDVMLRISQLVTEYPEISELDINPLFVYKQSQGSSALDVKITITLKHGGIST
jgi:acetyltransferase